MSAAAVDNPLDPWPACGHKNVPAVFLGYQQRWNEDESEVKVCEKSRRIGLTWGQAADDVLLASTEAPHGQDVLYISYNQEMTREYIDTCAWWAKHFARAASSIEEFLFEDEDPTGEKRSIKAFRISFASGKEIVALSSRPKNLRGKQGRVVIDEAAFVEDLEALLEAALAFLIWGGQVIVVSTHYGDDNPFNELVQEIRAGKKPYSLHRITFDEALADGLYRRICLVRGIEWSQDGETAWREKIIASYGDKADQELFCVPSKGSGIFFQRVLIESCMDKAIPVLRWACKTDFAQAPDLVRTKEALDWCRSLLLPSLDELRTLSPHSPSYYGMDFGRIGDLSGIVPLQETTGLSYRAPFVVELRNVPFRQQEEVLFYLVDRLPRFSGGAMDARGNGQYLAEVAMQKYGAWRIQQVMLTQEWYRDNMPRYKAAFEDRKISLPLDPDILDDHRAVKMEKGIAKVPEGYRGKGRDGGQRHGDLAIAGALAWFAAMTDAGPIAYGADDPEETERLIARNLRKMPTAGPEASPAGEDETEGRTMNRLFGGAGAALRRLAGFGGPRG